MIFYYSGCGNSRYVASLLADQTGEELIYIPTALKSNHCKYQLKEGERVGFVFPIYGWRPPEIIKSFMNRLKLTFADKNKQPYVFAVCTCGDNMGYADNVFRRYLKQLSLDCDTFLSITMPETYLNLRSFQLDTPANAVRKIELAHANLSILAKRIQHGVKENNVTRGKFPALLTYLIGPLFTKFAHTADRHYHVDTDACISCGLCAKICPVEDIEMIDGHPHWRLQRDGRERWQRYCISCMACYQYCPKNAIHYGNITYGKGQYVFPTKKFPLRTRSDKHDSLI